MLILDALTLRHRLLAALLLSATLATLVQFNFRFKALRHRGFPALKERFRFSLTY
jgi:hypothetical protein